MRLNGNQGVTLIELAVVLMIVGLLLSSVTYTLSAQIEQRAREQTQRTLEQAREALLGYAIANGRLPCPASSTSSGAESVAAGECTHYYDGFLPAVTLGFQSIDAWNNPIRYAVARNLNTATCAGTSTVPHFTSRTALKQNGMSCLPAASELLICKSTQISPAPSAGSCGVTDNAVTNANPSGTVVAIVFSAGKNYALAPTAPAAMTTGKLDESANLDGDTVFISHSPAPAGAIGGEFDDQMVWISVGMFYGRMVTAGVLP